MPARSRPGIRQVARRFRAAGQRQRVILLEHLARIDRALAAAADMGAVVEGDAFAFHLRHAAVDDVLFHLEVGNAVTQQAAGLGVFLEHMHVVAGARELLRAGQARRARSRSRRPSCRSCARRSPA